MSTLSLSYADLMATFEKAECLLLTEKRIPFTFERYWSSFFPNTAGLYAIFDNGKLVYIGESANVKERMKELKRTVNHTFRRKLCTK